MNELLRQAVALQLSACYLKLTYHEQQLETIIKKLEPSNE